MKPPKKILEKPVQNEWIVNLFNERTTESRLEIELLRCLPEIHRDGGDLVGKTITRRISMEYDWKRRPINPAIRPIQGSPHLYFDTVPWGCLYDFLRCREKWESFRKRGEGSVLRTIDDLGDFQHYLASEVKGLKTPRRNAAVTIAKRMFLRAYTRSAWGLDARAMSYAELAHWLTEAGYPTTKKDVENARRPNAELVEQAIVQNGAANKLLALIQSRFPSFEGHRLTAPQGKGAQLG